MKAKTFCFLLFAAICLLGASDCRAYMEIYSFTTDPPVPTDQDSITAIIGGMLTTTCDTVSFDEFIMYDDQSGKHFIVIYLNHVILDEFCLQVVTDFLLEVPLGRLQEGTYRTKVVTIHCDFNFTPPELDTTTDVDWPIVVSQSSSVDEEANVNPREFILFQNFPNPFNQFTRIEFTLEKPGPVCLEIHDLLGRRVRSLSSGCLSAGHKSVLWDGKDDSGAEVASGVYLYQMVAGEFSDTKKLVLLK